MTYSEPARITTRRIPPFVVAGLLFVVAALASALGYQLLASSSLTAASPIDILRVEHGDAPDIRSEPRDAPPLSGELRGAPAFRGEPRRANGEAAGAVPDSTTVFDDEIPGVANLDPALLAALRRAAPDAADDGVMFFVNSGWRSAEYQEQLLQEAVSKYGSEKEAARWVSSPSTSAHVSGEAVDIGPSVAAAWLSKHGTRYGLCQIYKNEPWHFELRPGAIAGGCPPMYADPTHDPRMNQ